MAASSSVIATDDVAPADVVSSYAPPPPATPAAAVAFVRLLFVVALAISGSFWGHPTRAQTVMFYVWGLGWLPWSILVVFAGDGARRRHLATISGVIADLAVLLTSLAVFKDVPGFFLIALLMALIGGWLTWHELPRTWSAVAVVAAAATIRTTTEPIGKGIASSVAFAMITAVAGLLWMRTDRVSKRAEALTTSLRSRAETVLARVPHPLVISGPGGRIVSCNPATLEALGELDLDAPCCEALGLHHGERVLKSANGCALLELCRSAEGQAVEVWRYRADGSRQPLLAAAAEIPDNYGRVSEVVHSLRDITRLKEADEAKTIFLATASHELKTPLTVINGYAQLLLREDNDASLRRQGLQAISVRSRELAEIVERLLLSSRIESGRLTVTLAPVDIAVVACERVDAFATATGQAITLEAEAGLPLVDADATALATILDHLIDNGIKYTSGEGPIDVTVRGSEHGVTLSVRDHGIGMTEEQRRRCFDKFWQGESGDNRRHGGTGLGLYIVKSLVDSMAGRISVLSRPGEGTTFVIALPTPGGHLPMQRSAHEPAPSMIRESMRQVGVPKSGAGN